MTPFRPSFPHPRSCVLSRSRQVKCFGNNIYGMLGYGDTANRGLRTSEMGDALPFVDVYDASFLALYVLTGVAGGVAAVAVAYVSGGGAGGGKMYANVDLVLLYRYCLTGVRKWWWLGVRNSPTHLVFCHQRSVAIAHCTITHSCSLSTPSLTHRASLLTSAPTTHGRGQRGPKGPKHHHSNINNRNKNNKCDSCLHCSSDSCPPTCTTAKTRGVGACDGDSVMGVGRISS